MQEAMKEEQSRQQFHQQKQRQRANTVNKESLDSGRQCWSHPELCLGDDVSSLHSKLEDICAVVDEDVADDLDVADEDTW